MVDDCQHFFNKQLRCIMQKVVARSQWSIKMSVPWSLCHGLAKALLPYRHYLDDPGKITVSMFSARKKETEKWDSNGSLSFQDLYGVIYFMSEPDLKAIWKVFMTKKYLLCFWHNVKAGQHLEISSKHNWEAVARLQMRTKEVLEDWVSKGNAHTFLKLQPSTQLHYLFFLRNKD